MENEGMEIMEQHWKYIACLGLKFLLFTVDFKQAFKKSKFYFYGHLSLVHVSTLDHNVCQSLMCDISG